MRYKFNDFEFDSTSLVLKKNGQTLAIRHNEAKVLKLLIEHSDNVVSKEDILSHVWQDKVVSEQAVFQNISHLRSLSVIKPLKPFQNEVINGSLKLTLFMLILKRYKAVSIQIYPTNKQVL